MPRKLPVHRRAADAENTSYRARGLALGSFGALLLGVVDLLPRQFRFGAGPDATSAGGFHAFAGPFGNQAALKLGERGEDIPARCHFSPFVRHAGRAGRYRRIDPFCRETTRWADSRFVGWLIPSFCDWLSRRASPRFQRLREVSHNLPFVTHKI